MNDGRPIIGITLDRDGEYLRLKHRYAAAMADAGATVVLLPAENDPLCVARGIDGLLIPGGMDIDPAYFSEAPHPATRITPGQRTDFEIHLLRAIMEVRKPVFGICYGMQLINVAFGGSLYQDIAAEFGVAVDHSNGRHRIKGEGQIIKGETWVNTSHHQGVKMLGERLEACAVSDDGLVEAIRMPDYSFLMGVQWHPERDDDELSSRLFKSFVEACL